MILKMSVNNIDWSKISDVFPILQLDKNNDLKEEKNCTETEYNEAVEMIISSNMADDIERLIFSRIEKIMRQEVIPKFWSHFSDADGKTAMNDFRQFHNAVEELYRDLSVHIPLISKLEKLRLRRRDVKMYGESNIFNAFKLLLRSTLLSQLPPSNHNGCIENFYQIAFRAFCHLDETDDAECCGGCLANTDCQCQTICNLFFETNRRLVELDLLEPLVGQVLTSLIQIRIENHITQICNNSYDTSYIEQLEKWLNSVVMTWLNQIYCVNSNIQLINPKIKESMIEFERKLKHLLFETITKTRINQLFTIIIEYPDSLPAVEDLNKTLPNTDLRPLLINQLKMALENRLLHAGVSTPDILTAYIAAIRSLRVLDPTGVLVNTVSVPIHKYLRSREDTVRCVVGSLTEEGPNCDLADELARGQSLNETREDWEQWLPDPIDVDPSKSSKNQTSSDIISMLVNVYGSKELFVNEYRNLLADRLLSQSQCNTDKEIRYLELLKLRFGESQLHFCEVMLKDICDSKRINTHLQNDQQYKTESEHFPLSALIISAQFWPVFKEETLQLPSIIVEQFQYFTKAFETLKGNRTLCWKPHLGSVQLEIELKDRVLNLTVSPLQASIIMSFQTKPQWNIDELSQELKVPATLLRKKINFWQSQAILREISNDVFLLIEENSTAKSSHSCTADIIICEDDEAESAMASSQDQREEELQVFWSYIIGMLTNLDSMPLERIHQMLKMFASQGPTAIECSLQELRHFLDRKVREHKLIFTAGYYRLPKI